MSYRPVRKQGLNPIWVLIGVNTVIFLATLLNPSSIYDTFGLSRTTVMQQPWTIVTYMFLHGTLPYDLIGSIYHILANMITLYFFGTFVMYLVGETAFLTIYFVGGIFAGLAFILLAPNATVVGASGAIYALGGLLMIVRPNIRVSPFLIPVTMPLWIAVLVGFVLVAFVAGVAWQAHLGGLVLGVVVGLYYRKRERGRIF